ncbi:YdbL family protein [Sphingomonas bacterium]|uniref:YdbL family protein n=1 Tax=Sphingomonas bacterium TaxID=1895847 RepID=UPI001576D35E|nr:YdbL family protein [Sphingomonas bacterium]
MRLHLLAAGLAIAGIAVGASAQRDPSYAAARSSGEVGEQPDGYLGLVGAGTPSLHALVSDINIKRKAAYTRQASAAGATVEQLAFTSGCTLVEQTAPGEKYRAPGGVWKTRTAAAPERDGRCV